MRQVVGVVGARTVNAANLGPIPTLPLIGVSSLNAVDFIAQNASLAPVNNQGTPGPQLEAHLFVVDLTGLDSTLRGVGAAQPIQQWDDRARIGSVGMDVIIPFPPNPAWNLASRYRVPFLLPVVFWPDIEALPPATDPDPPGRGSVKSVRLYRPGLCSAEITFSDDASANHINAKLYDTVSDKLFDKFSKNDSLNGGSAQRAWSRVTTLLDDGLDIFGPRGGFFLYFWFTATAGPGGVQDINFAASYEYQFTLDDGRVAVLPTRNDLLVQPQSAFTSFRDALEKDLPGDIHQSFVDQQKFPFAPSCDGDSPARSISLLAGFADSGAVKLGLSQGDRDRVKAAISQPGNWSCDPVPGADAKAANFILRAKRINIYPDAIELVWFDQQNPDDPMFALFLASLVQSSGMQPGGGLCARPRTIVDGNRTAFVRRRLVTVSR